MADIKYPGVFVDHDPAKWEYDGGTPDFTGDIEKLSPYMQEIQRQISEAAFGTLDSHITLSHN